MCLLLVAIFCVVPRYRADPVDVTTEEPVPGQCEEISLITCFLPFVAFAFSDEAKDYTPEKAKGQITEAQFNRLCGSVITSPCLWKLGKFFDGKIVLLFLLLYIFQGF